MEDKLGRAQFFQKHFLLPDINIKIVLSMPFLIFNNINIQFVKKELIWKFYITAKALSTTKQVEPINIKKFAKVTLNENFEIFIVQVASLILAQAPGIYPDRAVQIALLLTKEVKILNKYADFINVFSEKKALVLPECIKLHEYTINLKDVK